jgi:hypothetical protein
MTETLTPIRVEPEYSIGDRKFYGVGRAAEYLGLSRDTFKAHLARNPTALPCYVVPANGRRAFAQETLDEYRAKWLTPQPA